MSSRFYFSLMIPVLIIGSSAAGASAAIYLARRNITFVMVGSDFGGEMAQSGEVGNYPGCGNTNGIALSDKFLEHVKLYAVEPELGVRITSLEKTATGFRATGWKDDPQHAVSYEAQSVIIATGAHPRELGISGEKELRGKGVSYCTVCDGPLYKNKAVVTVGGGDSASESGIMMNDIASHAYVVTKNPDMKGDASLIARLKAGKHTTLITDAKTVRIAGTDFVTGIEYQDAQTNETKTIEVDGVFIHIGMIPNAEFVMPDLARSDAGEIKIDSLCKTNIPGLFAAGDVTDMPYKQIGIAAGQGIIAALSCVDYLNKQVIQ